MVPQKTKTKNPARHPTAVKIKAIDLFCGAGGLNRHRRSAGKNLVSETDAWVTAVGAWIDKHGIDELVGRAGLSAKPDLRLYVFVIARYNMG